MTRPALVLAAMLLSGCALLDTNKAPPPADLYCAVTSVKGESRAWAVQCLVFFQ